MCGIAGLIRHGGLAPGDRAAVARMTEAQTHRGPDGGDYFADEVAALGHRRLAIIDLTADGTQPMPNEDATVWVTYNGEIYNYQELHQKLLSCGHRFRSHSDTEVLVHGYEQWGIDGLLQRLHGMFAFALYDVREQTILLARDHVGIKPLYYSADDDVLLFASEVKALLRSGYISDEHDREALTGFLLTGSVPSPRTLIKQISSLGPGQYLRWRAGSVSLQRHWTLPANGTGAVKLDEVAEELCRLLTDAVSRHLVSDVPVGVFLGGGVDSGAMVAFASRAMRSDRVKTLTVTFDESEFTETAAAETANAFGTDHREVRVTQVDFIADLPKLFAAMDQPTNDGVNTWFVSKAAQQSGLTVVLSGLGGDELFLGYSHYRRLALPDYVSGLPWPLRRVITKTIALEGRRRGKDNWMRAAFLRRPHDAAELYLLMRGFFPPQYVAQLLGISQRDVNRSVDRVFCDAGVSRGYRPASVRAAFNNVEFTRYLHDQLLRDTDVFSMAHSIEARVPLLDRNVVEFAHGLTARLDTPTGTNKALLVAAADHPVVTAAGRAEKRGFTLPMDHWMRSSGDDLEHRAATSTVVDRDSVSGMWKEFRQGRLHWSRAWALTVLGATTNRPTSMVNPADVPQPFGPTAVAQIA